MRETRNVWRNWALSSRGLFGALLLVEERQGDRHRLLGAGDRRLVGLDLLIGLEDLLLVPGVLLLERVEVGLHLRDALIALGDRGVAGGDLAVPVGDRVGDLRARLDELLLQRLQLVARRRQAAVELGLLAAQALGVDAQPVELGLHLVAVVGEHADRGAVLGDQAIAVGDRRGAGGGQALVELAAERGERGVLLLLRPLDLLLVGRDELEHVLLGARLGVGDRALGLRALGLGDLL